MRPSNLTPWPPSLRGKGENLARLSGQPTRVGDRGPGGASPLPGGLGDVPPQNQKKGRVAHLSNPAHEWDPKRRQTLSPRGRAKGGGPEGEAPSQGDWGMCPHKFKRRGELPTLATPPTSGTQYAGKHSANGGGQKGVDGAQAPSQGVWGMCPHKFKRGGEPPTLATPPTSGTQYAGKP
jgi:hypothetical protein